MARKSRFVAPGAAIEPSHRIYRTALYVRLSVLDGNREDSDSIENQENILRAYILGKEMFSLYGVYADNGQTGTVFSRDDWQRLLDDIRSGLVDCIIVKDLSRFGRNYIEAGEYLENIFPFMGVRFIAVNDGYDSIDPKSADSLSMHLKNLVNDIYARDISQKVSSVRRMKQAQGKFTGSFASFGYLRWDEDGQKLIIDEKAATIVREIYRLRLAGLGYSAIAKTLNEREIPSPGRYQLENGRMTDPVYEKALWLPKAVKTILSNELYIGNMVQGRKRNTLWERNAHEKIPKNEWAVVLHTHEAIIDTQTFEAVQRINAQKKSECMVRPNDDVKTTESPLLGLLYCGNCGKRLARQRIVRRNKHKEPKTYTWFTYKCGTHGINPQACCFTSIREAELLDVAYQVIQTQIALALDMEKLLTDIKQRGTAMTQRETLRQRISDTQQQQKKIQRHRESLCDDYMERLLTERDYLYAMNRYQEQETALSVLLFDLNAQEKELREMQTDENPWLQTFLKFQSEPILTRQMAQELIESVTVYSKTSISIKLRYRDEYQRLQDGLCSTREAAAHA